MTDIILIALSLSALGFIFAVIIFKLKKKYNNESIKEDQVNNEDNYMALGMSLGMCFGTSIGILISIFTNLGQIALTYGICFGMLFGMMVGLNIKKK